MRLRPDVSALRGGVLLGCLGFAAASSLSTIPIPLLGNGSLTHYDLPLSDYVASCGCGGNSSYYPTVALSEGAYGSAISAGPGCGQCFNLSLASAYIATPAFELPVADRPWIVVKVTDKCPKPAIYDPDKTWCGATRTQVNQAGVYFHFDISSPSPSVPLSFFPNASAYGYGYSDFGSWMITFESVSCSSWAGYTNDTASIVDPSVAGIGSTACCPADPLVANDTCRATSLKVGIGHRGSPGAQWGWAMGIVLVGVVVVL